MAGEGGALSTCIRAQSSALNRGDEGVDMETAWWRRGDTRGSAVACREGCDDTRGNPDDEEDEAGVAEDEEDAGVGDGKDESTVARESLDGVVKEDGAVGEGGADEDGVGSVGGAMMVW
jgi:hypothetical protein